MSWVLMIFAAEGLMWASRRLYLPKFDPSVILVRIAGACYAGAGVMGVTGWLGDLLTTVMSWVMSMADTLGGAAVGVALSGLLALAVGVMWFGAMVPDQLFHFDLPNWMVRFGLLLPSVLASAPGSLGEGLRTIVFAAGDLANGMVSGVF